MLKELTENYIQAFTNKDIETISAMLNEQFVLEDPVVKRIEGKENALEAIKNIFASCSNLEFKAKNIYVLEPDTTMIEFTLQLDSAHLQGVDIIEWQNKQLKELRAYLDIPK
jgi:ketosteroid isomerase-like protein